MCVTTVLIILIHYRVAPPLMKTLKLKLQVSRSVLYDFQKKYIPLQCKIKKKYTNILRTSGGPLFKVESMGS